jgi:hypothetical protein
MICLYLPYSTSFFDNVVGGINIFTGVAIYVFFSPKQDIHYLKALFLSKGNLCSGNGKKRTVFGNFDALKIYDQPNQPEKPKSARPTFMSAGIFVAPR